MKHTSWKQKAEKILICGLLSSCLFFITFTNTSCVGKYKETIGQLEFEKDSLDILLQKCMGNYHNLQNEYDILNEEYNAELVRLRSDFVDVIEVYRQIAVNQTYIEDVLHQIKLNPESLTNISPSVFEDIESRRGEINIMLTQADRTIERMETEGSALFFNTDGSEQRQILTKLREQLETERSRFQVTTKKINELQGTIDYLKLKLQINQDSCANYYRTILEQRRMLETQLRDFEMQLFTQQEMFQMELNEKERSIYFLDSLRQGLEDTLVIRKDTILALKKRIQDMQEVFVVEIDKSSAKKLHFARNINSGKLKPDFREIVLNNTSPIRQNKYQKERIVCEESIIKLLPERPTHSYNLYDNNTVLYINDPGRFWAYDDILVIVTK